MKINMRKVLGWILGLIVLALAVFVASKLIQGKKRPPSIERDVVKTAFVHKVINENIPVIIPLNGSIKALRKVELFAEVQGIFEKSSKLFKSGTQYREGDILIRMDGSEFYASIRSRRSDLFNQITAAMPDLRLDYPEIYPKWENYLKNLDINAITPQLPEFASDQEKFYITGKGIIQTYYSIKNLEERYSKYTIRAPFSGILTEANVNPGTLIRSGQKLGEFIDPSEYEMEVAVNKSYIDFLVPGKEVQISDLEEQHIWTGILSRINGKIDQTSQTVKVYISVKGENLREGMYLQADLKAADQKDAIEISRKLLVENAKVYVVKDSVLSLEKVTPLYFSDKSVILTGLKDGDMILKQPIPGAYHGMKVKIFDEKN